MNLKMKRTSLAMMQAVLALGMAGCGGASDNPTDAADAADAAAQEQDGRAEALRFRSRDTVAPTVTVGSSPVVGSTGLINLSGTAADNRRVYRVLWNNDRGGTGTASLSGTSTAATWVATGVQLQTGTNIISVTAVDGAGNVSGTATLTLTRGDATTPTPVPVPVPVPAPAPVLYTLTVASGTGGQVTSAPTAISCGVAATTCAAQLPSGTSVSLTATPTAGYRFNGWSGNCSGTGACVVTMSSANSVTASFAAAAWVVQLSWVAGSGGAVAGYRLYHGNSSGTYPDNQSVSSPSASFSTATPGLHYFAVSAVNATGNESARSAEISVNVN